MFKQVRMSLKKRSLRVQDQNSAFFNVGKAQEELTELLLVLIQNETKVGTSSEVTEQDIIDEIGDAKRMLWYLEKKYGKKKVKARIEKKVIKLEKKYKLC